MTYISIHNAIEIAYEICGFEGYVFGKDKSLYNIRTGRKLKHTVNNRSIGWWLNGKFMSHSKLKPLLRKPTKIDAPF